MAAKDKQTDTDTATKLKNHTEVDVSDIARDRPTDPTLATAIENANALLEQKRAILGQLQGARQLTTLLVEQGIGSPEQVQWVRFYLPRKTRGSNGGGVESGDES